MPKVVVTISLKQQRALQRQIHKAGKGTVVSEIHKAIRQHLDGPRYIETAFAKLLEQKAPKDLPVLLAQLKKNTAKIKGNLREIKQIRERPRPPQGVNQSQLCGLANMALDTLGSAEKANSWFYRPNKLLKDRTPFSLLSSATGVKRVMKALNQKSREGQKEWAVTRKASLRQAKDPQRSLLGTKVENARVERMLKRGKRSPLPVLS